MSAGSDLRAALSFLTPLGGGGQVPSPTAMAWFPAVGAGIGWALGQGWRLASKIWPPLPAAALVVTGDCLVTGALHLDGLADAADGLLAHSPGRSRLDIMAEPHVGGFGTVAVGLALLGRASALAGLGPSPALLAGVYCSSRSAMVVASRALPYARAGGLASAFLPAAADAAAPPGTGQRSLPTPPGPKDRALLAAVPGLAAALLLAWLGAGRRGPAAIVAGWGASLAVLGLARRRLGGFTGDVLGAAGVVGETAALLAAAARRAT